MNRGSQLLSKRIERGGQKALAAKLGVNEGNMSRIVNGIRLPTLHVRTALEDQFGIPIRAWDEPAEAEEPAPAEETAKDATGTEG